MNPALQKSFGGLSRPYYLRQFFFGLLLAIVKSPPLSTQPVAWSGERCYG